MTVGSRRTLDRAGAALFGVAILIWTLTPLYNMVLVAVQQKEDVFATNLFPPKPTLESFSAVFNESYWYLANYWRQMGNSAFIGVAVALLTLAIGSMTSKRREWKMPGPSSTAFMKEWEGLFAGASPNACIAPWIPSTSVPTPWKAEPGTATDLFSGWLGEYRRGNDIHSGQMWREGTRRALADVSEPSLCVASPVLFCIDLASSGRQPCRGLRISDRSLQMVTAHLGGR